MNDLTPARVFAEYDRAIRVVEAWVHRQSPRIPGCDDDQVRARLVQRIVQITEVAFCQQVVDRARRPGGHLEAPPGVVRVNGLTLDLASGRVRISLRQWLTNLAYFTAAWGDLLIEMVRGLFRGGPEVSTRSTILLEAGGDREDTDRDFVDFCRQGPIAPLRDATRLIVQSVVVPRRPAAADVVYTRKPVAALINRYVRTPERWMLLAAHLSAPLRVLGAIRASRLNVLISRDFSLLPVMRRLDRAGRIEALVATTSAFPAQPLWMKGMTGQAFKLHMLWYSQNFVPKLYRGDAELQSLPSARHIRVDEHWVWTEGFGQYLQGLRRGVQAHVAGPILWYLSRSSADAGFGAVAGDDVIRIGAFDVTPLPDGYVPHGAARNYYSVDCMKRFVADTLEVAEAIAATTGKRVVVLLKHKRTPTPGFHDSSYLAWLKDKASHGTLVLIAPTTNLYGLLEACHLSVSVPYTTAAYVGPLLSKPSIYYDPTADLIPVFESHPLLQFASGPSELSKLMTGCLLSTGTGVIASGAGVRGE